MINKFSILNGAKYFSPGIFQNYLVFVPAKKYIKYFSGTARIDFWKSNGMSEENIENITKSDSNFAPTSVDHRLLPDINLNGHCLINNIPISKKVINLYISYTLSPWLRNVNADFTLNNCLFGSVKLSKNADPDKCKYRGYSIGFDCRPEFSFTDESMRKNVIIFGADISSPGHIDNKGKDILILGEGPTQGLYDTTLTAETIYPINFKEPNKRFVYTTLHYTTLHYTTLHYSTLHYTTLHYTTLHYTTLHYTTQHYTTLHYTTLHYTMLQVYTTLEATSYLLMLQKYTNLKKKNSEIKDYVLCLGNTSKDLTINNMKKKSRIERSCKIFLCLF